MAANKWRPKRCKDCHVRDTEAYISKRGLCQECGTKRWRQAAEDQAADPEAHWARTVEGLRKAIGTL